MNSKVLFFILFLFCFSLMAQEESDSLEIKKLLGEAYLINKDYKHAEEEYEALLKEHPQDTKTRLQYADMLSWQKKYGEALREYRILQQQAPDDPEILKRMVRILIQDKKYEEAFPLLEKILKRQPENAEALEAHGDLLSYNQEYEKAISEYQTILKQGDRPEVLRKLGDVLSWMKRYEEALKAYDQVLSLKTEGDVLLQKARVLGWMQHYEESLRGYESLNSLYKSPLYALEMKGKKAYWSRRHREAATIYKELLAIDPENLEAGFDLSQIYFYSGQYDLSDSEFEKILQLSPTHFRAKEGLEKSRIMTQEIRLSSEVEEYKASSVARDTDIDRKSFFLSFDYPFKSWFRFSASLRQNQYDFRQSKLKTQDVKTGFHFYSAPYVYGNFFYKALNSQDSIEDLGKAGMFLQGKAGDLFQWEFFSEQNRLDNSERVLRQSLYSDDLKANILFVLNRNWDLGLEYQHSELSDSNTLENPAVFLEYIPSFEPRRFSVEYRLDHKRYELTTPQYFSPDRFSTHFLYLHWKQYLNKNEIFSGSDNLYYRLTPGLSYDSEDLAGYSLEGEAGWDVNKKFNLNIKARLSDLEKDVYEDRYIKISAVWYL